MVVLVTEGLPHSKLTPSQEWDKNELTYSLKINKIKGQWCINYETVNKGFKWELQMGLSSFQFLDCRIIHTGLHSNAKRKRTGCTPSP